MNTSTLLAVTDDDVESTVAPAAGQSVHVVAAAWRMANSRPPVAAPPHFLTLRSNSPGIRELWREWLSDVADESVAARSHR